MTSTGLHVVRKFRSGAKEIRIETYGPAEAEDGWPSIVALHGATGIEFANRFIAVLAQEFAAEGFLVHLVHYFDRTGSVYASDDVIKRSSHHWLSTIEDALAFIRREHPGSKIGLFGYSLGGYLAAAQVVRDDGVATAVILSGGLDEESARLARWHAPTLILHGGADRRVPLAEAQRLESTLRSLGGTPEVHVYPGEGHLMSFSAYADVVARAGAFFQERLMR
jgi:carboxymethylenebutenolidase